MGGDDEVVVVERGGVLRLVRRNHVHVTVAVDVGTEHLDRAYTKTHDNAISTVQLPTNPTNSFGGREGVPVAVAMTFEAKAVPEPLVLLSQTKSPVDDASTRSVNPSLSRSAAKTESTGPAKNEDESNPRSHKRSATEPGGQPKTYCQSR